MSTRLLDLKDRIITDTGSMVAKHELLVNLALDGEPITHLPFESHPDIHRYHVNNGTTDIAKVWVEDDNLVGPSQSSFEWTTPPEYNRLDIEDLCLTSLVDIGKDDDLAYLDRLTAELALVKSRNMNEFFHCLVWITDTLRVNDQIWGLGRGSSCASLILYLLGINKVDPVKYDIDMEEFYK